MRDAALTFHNLTLGYDRHPAVHHLEGVVASGALLAVVGPNGAGKSTLLKAIAGMITPMGGQIERASAHCRDLAYLPQAAELDRSFPISVFDMVAMGLLRRAGFWGGIGGADIARINQAIAAVGLTGFERRAIGTLSGGQLQRALFARLLLQDAPVILLDEPFSAIDTKTAEDLMALVRAWHGEQRTVIAVLHDMEFVRHHFPQTLLIARELIAWGASEAVLTPDNLLRARRMVEAHDPGAPVCQLAAE